ncbi:MAG: undecaprenyl-diphosphate phosphatase [Magnetospirillum sp.]|nr:undecaprenyl-diphosphate phosphatase [Magnetospirillum sp.]
MVVLSLIQGLGEVLPVSASGHLTALPALAGSAEGRAAIGKGRPDAGTRLFMHVAVGAAPALLVGWLYVSSGGGFGSPTTAVAAMLVFGLFLLVADQLGMTVSRVEHISWAAAFGIGVLQAAALIPGVSRTGITITAARLMGYERRAAARFSLLLAIPAFAAHGAWTFRSLARNAEIILSVDLAYAAATAGVAALLAVAAMMAWVDRHSFAPFAIWRVLFAGAMLLLMWWK